MQDGRILDEAAREKPLKRWWLRKSEHVRAIEARIDGIGTLCMQEDWRFAEAVRSLQTSRRSMISIVHFPIVIHEVDSHSWYVTS